MKFSTVFLIASVLANIALIAGLVYDRKAAAGSTSATPATGGASVSPAARMSAPSPGSIPGKATPATTKPSASQFWNGLHTDDLDRLAAELRAAGFPPKTVRAIVMNLYDERSRAAQLAIRGQPDDARYWKPQFTPFGLTNPEQRAKLNALMAEQSKLWRKWFSASEAIRDDEAAAESARRRFGNLAIEKLQRVSKIEEDYSELRDEIYRTASSGVGGMTPPDGKKLALIESEQRRDMQQALTPEEFAEYELRSSSTANGLRERLQLFRASESEYKALFAVQRSLDLQFPNDWSSDDQTRIARAKAMEAMKPQLQTALGPERYADYVQAMEGGSDKLSRLMGRLELPLSTVGKITTVRDDINQRAAAVRADAKLAPAQRDARLAALALEAQTKVTAVMGSTRGYEAYDDMKGEWIRALKPKPVTP